MKNYFMYAIKSKLCLSIEGNNIERFIKRLKNNNIEILNIKYIKKNKIYIKIYKKDYEALMSIKTIYKVNLVEYFGLIKLKNNILNNKYLIICILVALIFMNIITNLIFSIDILTNDSKMKNELINELKDLGIKKYSFKKTYEEIQVIKKKILNNHKEDLQWIEIESLGTKYIVKYEPRVITNIDKDYTLRNIVALKDAVITDMDISRGQIVKNVKSYVKAGEVIVSGFISLNDNIKNTVSAQGTVYGETWRNVLITYPYKYYESIKTGTKKNVFVIKFLNKQIELFNFNKYKTKTTKDFIILKNSLLPIMFMYQTQEETKVKDELLTENQLIEKAINYSKNKIETSLSKGEYVKDYKVLSKQKNDDSITLNIFFSVIEDITDYEEITEYNFDDQSEE